MEVRTIYQLLFTLHYSTGTGLTGSRWNNCRYFAEGGHRFVQHSFNHHFFLSSLTTLLKRTVALRSNLLLLRSTSVRIRLIVLLLAAEIAPANKQGRMRRTNAAYQTTALICFAMATTLSVYALPMENFGKAPSRLPRKSHEMQLRRSLEILESLGIHGCLTLHEGKDSSILQEFPSFYRCEEDENVNIDASGNQTFLPRSRDLEQYEYTSEESDSFRDQDDAEPQTFSSLLVNVCLSLLCILGGSLASGLTVGLLSMDPLLLLIKIRAGKSQIERRQAEVLLPVIKKHHDLLVTLLLLNTIAGEALPIFLQNLVPDTVAVVMSVVIVLIFGEILPTAIFVGPNQLRLAGQLAPLVNGIVLVLSPITYPIARLLDRIMRMDGKEPHHHGDDEEDEGYGSHCSLYNRSELAALIRVQHEERLASRHRRRHQRAESLVQIPDVDNSEIQIAEGVRTLKLELMNINQPNQVLEAHQNTISSDPSTDSSIHNDEVTIIEGALQLKTKRALDIYLSYHKVFCIAADTPLDDTGIFTIYASGYSRVPVFVGNDRRRIKGILMTRQLIVVGKNNRNGAGNTTVANSKGQAYQVVSDLSLHVPQCVHPTTNLVDLVNLFQTGGYAVRTGHMALVCAEPNIANAALDRGEAIPEEAGVMG